MPLYEEDDFLLSESCAIAKYLCDRGSGTSLYPRDLETRALIDQHIGILNDMRNAQSQYTFLVFFGPKMRGLSEEPEKASAAHDVVVKFLKYYEGIFADKEKKYILDQLTIADFMLAVQLQYSVIIKDIWNIQAEFPNIARYYNALTWAHSHFKTELDAYNETVKKFLSK